MTSLLVAAPGDEEPNNQRISLSVPYNYYLMHYYGATQPALDPYDPAEEDEPDEDPTEPWQLPGSGSIELGAGWSRLERIYNQEGLNG